MFLHTFLILAFISLLASTPSIYAQEPLPSADPIFFDFDSSSLNQQAREQVSNVLELMKDNPKLLVTIGGHTDERGSSEFSMAVSERRAKAAMNYLVNLGIAPERITIMGYGKSKPLDPRHNEIAWARNRRVDFLFRTIRTINEN